MALRRAGQEEAGDRGDLVASTANGPAARPVMADVARLAGVSHQTVSRVLNGHPNVRPQTRDDVLAAIRELGYRPNAAARSLVTGRTHTLGVISFDTTLYGPASMLYGIERAAHSGYSVTITSLPAFESYSMQEAADRFLGQGVEGIIVIASEMPALEALVGIAADIPLVAVGCGTRAPLDSVAIDNISGAFQATRYLLDLGHETVHYIGGPDSTLDALERAEGWVRALREAGAPEPEIVRGDWSARSGYEIGHQLAMMPEVTAVFCANDQMALGVLRAMGEHGRQVPTDASVVGFDDIPESAYFLPPLTTVRQDFGELGRQALRLLVDRISGRPAPGARLPVAPELIVRASATRPPRR
jgi:DNA-binding LacI/PurR family transcriptional regulator